MKGSWRKVLDQWKNTKKSQSIDKSAFPGLLKTTIDQLSGKDGAIIRSVFEKAGIYPLNKNKVLNMLPSDNNHSLLDSSGSNINDNLIDFLKEIRFGESTNKKIRKSRFKLPAGKSIKGRDLDLPESESDVDGNLEEKLNDKVESSSDDDDSSDDDISEVKSQSTSSGIGGTTQMPINVLHNNIDEGTWVAVNFGNI